MKAYFLRSGFQASDADDLVQETFLRAYKSIRTFDPQRGRFGTWISTIARNVTRRRWGSRDGADSYDPEIAAEVFEADLDRRGDPQWRERMDAVSDCVGELPDELHRVVRLRYVDGLTTRAIAAETGLAEATVRLRLKESQALIQNCLRIKGIVE